jgi:antitoxin component YwqK of YwqJK toxin-antitoxin module
MDYGKYLSIDRIIKKNGVYTYVNSDEKVTGCVFYESEGAKYEMNLKNGLLDGEQKKWDSDDGRLWTVENYKNGIKNGHFKCWGWNRKLFWEYKYAMGDIEYSRHYNENGGISSEYIKDKNGSITREYWENGQLRCEKKTNKEGLIKGIKYFSERGVSIGSVELIRGNGTLIVENRLEDGTRIKFSENYKGGKLDGLKTSWINGSLNYKEHYKEGLKDGVSDHWYSNGQIHNRINYKKGQVDGLYQTWLFNGTLSSEGYEKMGKKNGSWRWWHDNGMLEREECYINDLAHGIHKEFNDKGVLLKEENYINGKRSGLQKFFSEDGTLINETNLINGNGIIVFDDGDGRIEEIYVNGQLKNWSSYEHNGDLIMEKNWKNGKLHGPTRIFIFDSISKDLLNESYREENYKNGELHGIRTALTKYDTVKYKEIWENGELVLREK